MTNLIECIPNFSEGRNEITIAALADAAQSVKGVTLLDYSVDKDHNRSVFTLMGNLEGVETAAVLLAKIAAARIDLTKHKGEHPRMGAVDVIPFVPVKNVSMQACISLSQKVGKRIWNEARLPVFLYGRSATSADRENLANIRRGEFEGLAEKMLDDNWKPDFGGREPHETAGVTAVGARFPLIAYNINLKTPDINIAKNIAKAVRESSGGLKHCKAIGVMLEDKDTAQVSMNMTNFDETPLHAAFNAVKREAKKYGVAIKESEIVGLTPAKALSDSAAYYLKLKDFEYEKMVLENYIIDQME